MPADVSSSRPSGASVRLSTKDVRRRIAAIEGTGTVEALSRNEYKQQVTKGNFWIALSAWPLILRRLFVEFFYKGLMDRGAILSFFTLLTTVPTLTAFYAIILLVLDSNRAQVDQITAEFIESNIPKDFADNVQTAINMILGSTQQSIITLIISVALALFSSSAYVRAFSRNANSLYGRLEGRSLVRTWLTMWGLTIMLVFGLVGIAVAFFFSEDILQPILDGVAEPLQLEGLRDFLLTSFLPVWGYIRWPVIFGASIVLIAMLYHFAPNVSYGRVRWLTTGSVFALASATAVGIGVRLYWQNFLNFGTYGALGGLIAGFIGLVAINTLLLMGLKLDAEVTRFRELQAGLDSAALICVPPNSDAALEGQKRLDRKLEESAEAFAREVSSEN